MIYINDEQYGQALSSVNVALKKIPSKDKEFVALAYSTRAKINLCLQDTLRAINDYSTAIKTNPDFLGIYNLRAQVYYERGQYEKANADYSKMISLDEGDVLGYMGIGRNANVLMQWDDAILQFDHVVKLAPNYSSGYSFRAEAFIGKKDYAKAIDDVITALSIDNDDKAYYLLNQLADSAFTNTISKLKIQKAKEPNGDAWPYYIGVVLERGEKIKDAISSYIEAFDLSNNPIIAYSIANCYYNLGNYEQAISYCNQAIKLDSLDTDYIFLKANIENEAGLSKDAISTLDIYLSKNPEYGYGYYRRGWFKDHSGDIDGAIDDYNMCITLIPEYAYCYLNRGVLYLLKGEIEAAKKDFEQVIKLDTIQGEIECAQYAYYYLGHKEKAIEIVDEMLKKNDKGDFYDAACLYSIMGEKEKAIRYLRKSLELGYRRFSHINRDRDLDNIRSEKEFIDLINEYIDIHKQETNDDNDVVIYEERTEIIPFSKDGDMCKVKCVVNGLPLHFIFDTGASDVSLSSVEATFMFKNGYLSASDVIGKQNFLTASGEVSEGTVLNIREVKFGNLHLEHVRASVVKNQMAPLLLGQSVLQRLGKIEIDNVKRNINITYKFKK